jgi:hypothetical protein
MSFLSNALVPKRRSCCLLVGIAFALLLGSSCSSEEGLPKQTDVSVMGWLWNQDSSYKNALLTNEGLPNATAANGY